MKSLMVNMALVLALIAGTSGNAKAQRKSPALAGLMSFVLPGTGQLYTQQTQKGLSITGTYLGAVVLGIVYGPWTWEKKSTGDFAELNPGTPFSTKLIFYGSAAIAGGALIYSVFDAVGAAKKLNSGQISLVPYSTGGTRGLRMSLRTNW